MRHKVTVIIDGDEVIRYLTMSEDDALAYYNGINAGMTALQERLKIACPDYVCSVYIELRSE